MADHRTEPELPDEVPEADAQEQRRGLVDDEELEDEVSTGDEVPEADALEQSRSVGDAEPDEYYE